MPPDVQFRGRRVPGCAGGCRFVPGRASPRGARNGGHRGWRRPV